MRRLVPRGTPTDTARALSAAGFRVADVIGTHTYDPPCIELTHPDHESHTLSLTTHETPSILHVHGPDPEALVAVLRDGVPHYTLRDVREVLTDADADASDRPTWLRRLGPLLFDRDDAELRQVLVDALDHDDSAVRLAAVLAMGDAGPHDDWVPALEARYEEEPDDAVAAWMGELLTAWR